MTAPDLALVEAAARARFPEGPSMDLALRLAQEWVHVIEPLIRESIARQIEAQATTQECVSARTWGTPISIFCGCWVCADQRAVAKSAAIARGAQ